MPGMLVSDPAVEGAKQAPDRVDILRHAVEVTKIEAKLMKWHREDDVSRRIAGSPIKRSQIGGECALQMY
jgi:hypothetical protein